MHDFYKERGLEIPRPGKFRTALVKEQYYCIMSLTLTLTHTTVMLLQNSGHVSSPFSLQTVGSLLPCGYCCKTQ